MSTRQERRRLAREAERADSLDARRIHAARADEKKLSALKAWLGGFTGATR